MKRELTQIVFGAVENRVYPIIVMFVSVNETYVLKWEKSSKYKNVVQFSKIISDLEEE